PGPRRSAPGARPPALGPRRSAPGARPPALCPRRSAPGRQAGRGTIEGVVLQATLLVLAGGDSRRMGRPKALLPVGDTTLVEWLTARLAPAAAHLLVAARDPAQLPPGPRPHLVRHRSPGPSPLASTPAG